MGKAFAQLLKAWLGDFGLVVIEGKAIRPAAANLFVRELEEYPKSSAAIKAGAELQQKAGYQP